MPNLVKNNLYITGTNKDQDVTSTLALFVNVRLSFQKLHPRPQEEDGNWYHWNCTYWGTKWEPQDISMTYNQEKGLITAEFETAWSPPTAFLTYLTEFYEGIKIVNTFSDETYDFVGQSLIENGQSESMYFSPIDYTFDALSTFNAENPWFDLESYENMIHSLNECMDPDGESCKCLENENDCKLSDVVLLSKTSETYEQIVERTEKMLEVAKGQ